MSLCRLAETLEKINRRLDEQSNATVNMQKQLAKIIIKQESNKLQSQSFLKLNASSIGMIALGILFHAIFIWIIARKH